MFGRNEKLKRLEAENKLSDALEKIEALRGKLSETYKIEAALKEERVTRLALESTIEEIKGKVREQSEADLVMASLKIIKAVLFEEKKKDDPYLSGLAAQQNAAMNNYRNLGGFIGSILG